MALVITTNAESDRVERQEQSVYSAYSYRNDIGSTYKIPPNSQVCLQSAKVNLDGRLTINNANSLYYDYFGKELSEEDDGTKLKDTIAYPILQDFSAGSNKILELTHEEFAALVEKEHREYHPNQKGQFNCSAKRSAGLDFEGYAFTYEQNLSDPDTNLPTSSRKFYKENASTRFDYNTGTGVFQRDAYAEDEDDPSVGILLGRPLSLAGSNRDLKVDISQCNGSGVEWAVGLSRDIPVTNIDGQYGKFVPPYFLTSSWDDEEPLNNHQFYADYCVHRDKDGIVRVTHTVPDSEAEIMQRELVDYSNNGSSDFSAEYNISVNASSINAVEFIAKGEAMEVYLDDGATKYLLTKFVAASDKDTYLKPITQTNWCLHPVLFVGGGSDTEPNASTCSVTVEDYAGIALSDYDSTALHKGGWFESALISGDSRWIKQCQEVDTRAILDPDEIEAVYTPDQLNASNGVGWDQVVMVVAPSSTYKAPLANTAQIFGFPDRAVVKPTSTVGNLVTFESDVPDNTENVKSMFVRLNGFGQQVLNALTKNKSAILAHLPTADSVHTDGGRIFYEPNRDIWLDLNNPYEIATSDFSIDIIYSNEQYARICQGQTIVVLYFRQRPDARE
jgi:hypothetical protein